ncbi:MAG: transcriptional repressor LexA [Verrucomicrobia bacterium]|nr:transcriptional repressor LexA [Verrucomicrobiota bacterium]
MNGLTRRQRQILEFLQHQHQESGVMPSFQEIADHFGFRSLTTVADHLRLLRRKGVLAAEPGRARSLRVVSPLQTLRHRVVDLPVFGAIPAGPPEGRSQEAQGCVTIDIQTLGIKPSPVAFALEVKGDSMIGRHIVSGDLVVIEPRAEPKAGDVVAALIDGESTLKTYLTRNGKPFLRAENPRYPDLVPAQELVVQGVMVALVRKRQ